MPVGVRESEVSVARPSLTAKHPAIISFALVKMHEHPKSAINMHASPSLQFTKQLITSPGNKSAAEATDCLDTPSGFRFIVHNKHMSRF